MIKQIIKKIQAVIKCPFFGVKYHAGLYLGHRVKFVGGGKIILSDNVAIMPYTMICSNGGIIRIGKNTQIGMFSRIASKIKVDIGKNVITGPNVFICDYNHEYKDLDKPIMFQGVFTKPINGGSSLVSIGDDSWIGTNVVIVGTVKIGKHCVIGANSVVTKDIPDYCVAVGIPAKVIKKFNFTTNKWHSTKEL